MYHDNNGLWKSKIINDTKSSSFFLDWLEREKRTALLIKIVHKFKSQDSLSDDDIWNLCRLTWITKGGGYISDADLMSTKLLALKNLLNTTDIDELEIYIGKLGQLSNNESHELIYDDTGIVNLYSAFRNISKQWIASNISKIRLIINRASTLNDDNEALNLYREIIELPPIKQPKTGSGLPAVNILTPLIACLDPRSRFPIINKAATTFLKDIDMRPDSKISIYLNLIKLIKYFDCNDALELDVFWQALDENLYIEVSNILRYNL